MSSLHDRLEYFYKVRNYIRQKRKEKKNTNVFNLLKRVELSETQGKFSETYTGYLDNIPVLVKIVPSKDLDTFPHPDLIKNEPAMKKTYDEIIATRFKIRQVIYNKFCPSFVLLYHTQPLSKFEYTNPYLKYKNYNSSIIMVFELYDITLKKWCMTKFIKLKDDQKDKKMLNILMNIWITLGCLYNLLKKSASVSFINFLRGYLIGLVNNKY